MLIIELPFFDIRLIGRIDTPSSPWVSLTMGGAWGCMACHNGPPKGIPPGDDIRKLEPKISQCIDMICRVGSRSRHPSNH